MRLVAQMKGGYYPAHEEAIALSARFLCPPSRASITILDPCAGTGAAIKQLGDLLGCPPARTYAIELDESRAQTLHDTLPDARVLAPASFFGCRASLNSFSFIWLNPPFDDGYGGHRVEQQFLTTATDWLMPGGVLAFVCPEDVVDEYSDARRHFGTYYQDCQIVPFPEKHRRFKEVVVFGKKRAKPQADAWGRGNLAHAPPGTVYDVPPATGPRLFQKVEPTEVELRRMLTNSPLRTHLTLTPQVPVPSPPLALGIGHVALLLASGQLDGVVHAKGGQPHVVRGTAKKIEYVSDVSEIDNPDGNTSTRTTISEKIELVVRTVDLRGRINTFSDATEECKAEESARTSEKSGMQASACRV
jgi:tRNA1(Val) A37 N6-methylase TrmN6